MKMCAAACWLFALASVALAADEPRRIDFTQFLYDDDTPFVDEGICPQDRVTGKRPCETPMTLGKAIYYALRMTDQGSSWQELAHRNELARGIRDSKDWPLTASDKDVIKRVLPRLFPSPPLIAAVGKLID